MDYKKISAALVDYDQKRVMVFTSYLKELETAKDKNKAIKNTWFAYLTAEQAIELYVKVSMDNLFIDGVTITLGSKGGKIICTYNYQAYKNKLLNVYPESMFDIQVVRQGDTYNFEKINGKVLYNHNINNPFATDKDVIGVYCIIKNIRGEFIETLDLKELQKMRNVAMTQNIWNEWFSEMCLKSIIKRACKRNFNDLVQNIDSLDNEQYELENVSVDSDYQAKIQIATTENELNNIYKSAPKHLRDDQDFVRLCAEKKAEINSDKPSKQGLDDEKFANALKQIKGGRLDVDAFKEKYFLTTTQLAQI